MTYLLRLVACLFLCVSLNSFGALHIRDLDGDLTNGHEGVYDDVLDITWMADAKLNSTFVAPEYEWWSLETGNFWDIDMPHWRLTEWVGLVNSHNGTGYHGFSGWRMPIVNSYGNKDPVTYNGESSHGYNFKTYDSETETVFSELGFMIYDNLGISPRYDTNGNENSSWGLQTATNSNYVELFSNLDYCSENGCGYYTGSLWQWNWPWRISSSEGYQSVTHAGDSMGTWLVHDGDISYQPSPVPLPAGIYLFLSGLVGLGLMRGKNG